MSATETEEPVEETEEESGPVVLHLRTTTDENSYIQFGSAEEAEEFANEIRSNAPGKFEAEVFPATDAQEILDANPPPEEEEEPEVNPQNPKPVAQAIPDRGTLEATSRADLDVVAEENGLNPDDYRNKGEIVDALDRARS